MNKRGTRWVIAGILALVVIVICMIGWMGPATGNVFSNIVSNAPLAPKEVIKTVEVEREILSVVRPTEAPPYVSNAYPASGQGGGGGILSSHNSNQPAMIIKDGSIDLLVEDTDRTLEQVVALAKEQSGYVISSSTYMDGKYKNAEIRLGVPSGVFEQTMNTLRRMGLEVLSESSSGQDVSAEYADLKIRLANLEATAGRVRSFLDEAETVEEALKVNSTLSQLEGEIDRIKGMMKFYEGRSAYSTISVRLSPQRPTPTPTVTPGWSPSQTFRDASDTSVRLMQGAADILIWFAVLFWPLAIVAVIVILMLWARKKLKKKPPRIESE